MSSIFAYDYPSDGTTRRALAELKAAFANAVKLEGHYSGGNDEGGYDQWIVIEADGSRKTIPYELPSGVNRGEDDLSLVDLLEEAFQEAHGYYSFAGEYQVHGTVTIDAATGRIISNHGRESHENWNDF